MAKKTARKKVDTIRCRPSARHTCLFYSSDDELLDVLSPYFKAGLEENEFCLWIIPEGWEVKDAKAALGRTVKDLDAYIEKGQMVIGDYETLYLKEGIFTASEMLMRLKNKEKEILEKGFNGIRASGDCTWAVGDWWPNFLYYEKELNKIIEYFKLRALCSYRINRLDPDRIIDIGARHPSSLVKRMGSWDSLDPENLRPLKNPLSAN